jgi:endoglucanase
MIKKIIVFTVIVFEILSGISLAADTNQFRGVNWADTRDNFVSGWLVLSGLNTSDSYSVVVSKAEEICREFQSDVKANTVRIPINHQTALESWWNSYCGIIDGALHTGMNVFIAYWEGEKDGKVDNPGLFWDMWQVVVNKYVNNGNVYFEVMNEPHGYSYNELVSLYDEWLTRFSHVPANRILLGGTGYSENVSQIGNESRFASCLLSQHLYGFWYSRESVDAWQQDLRDRIGSHAGRTILTEFGTVMTTGLNFNGPATNNEIRYLVGMTEQCRAYNMGSCYWPGVRDNDTYRLCTRSGTSLSVTNQSGLDRLHCGWGIEGGLTPTPEPEPTPGSVGDVNTDGTVDIVDALLIAQYYVGLDPSNFNQDAADVNCDGSIDIVDALLVAQYYVGLITEFC